MAIDMLESVFGIPIEVALDIAMATIAFASMLVFTPLVIRVAHHMGWVARPKADRWHQKPTALMGGIAIYLSALTALLVVGAETLPWPVWAGASVMFATGFVDDLKNIKPVTKLLAQVLATALLFVGGYSFGPHLPVWLSMPLTLFWVIGITNALNLLDNMDGLASGTAAIVATVLACFVLMSDSNMGAGAAFAVAGAAGGFLVFNFKPARIFMGDSGSLFLGYMISSLAIVMQSNTGDASGFAAYVVSIAVLAVPIFDTTLVTIVRTLSGRPVSQGGRDHSSHRLVFLGMSERRAVLTLYTVSGAFGTLVLLSQTFRLPLFYALTSVLTLGLIAFGIHLAGADVYAGTQSNARHESLLGRVIRAIRVLLGETWKVVFGMVADLLLIIAAYVLAYHLRFEDGLTSERELALASMLPVIIAIKLPVFYVLGLYRGLWKYAGTPEIVRVVKATTAASLLSFAVIAGVFGMARVSKGVFVIDWMILTITVTGLRLSFRGFRQYLSSKKQVGTRVLLYGAGDAGLLSLREIRYNHGLGMVPVGFIDDDRRKRGMIVHGLPVLGSQKDLVRIKDELQVDELLITAFKMSAARRKQIASICDDLNIPCKSFHLTFSELDVQQFEVPDTTDTLPIPIVTEPRGPVTTGDGA